VADPVRDELRAVVRVWQVVLDREAPRVSDNVEGLLIPEGRHRTQTSHLLLAVILDFREDHPAVLVRLHELVELR